MDLCEDHARLLTIPQFVLYSIPDSADALDDKDLANTTIESIASIASTVPEKSAEEVIPDFVIVHIIFRHIAHMTSWRDIKIKYAGVPLIAEVKRHPKRLQGLQGADFIETLMQRILLAESDAETQAGFLFRNYPQQAMVALVACSGDWWSCRLADRSQMVYNENADASQDVFEEGDDEGDDVANGDERGDASGSDDELDIMSAPEDAGPPDGLVLLEDRWCKVVQLGTTRSNRLLYLIHQHLANILANDLPIMG
jgi:hypothetical protein